jgi:hypothetical protein
MMLETMRHVYAEHVYAWERFFRAGLPEPGDPGARQVPRPRPAPGA